MITRILNENSLRRLARYIDGARRVVITTHMSPDGDAMGSSLAFANVLGKMGKDVKIVVPDQPQSQLMVLPGAKEVVVGSRSADFARRLFERADLICCLDFNELKRIDRLAPMVEASKAAKVMIDHHLHPSDFADVTISHPAMSSTCVLMFRVLCRLELFNVIDRDAAECLLAGMMTDTGNFSYNANDPDDYIIVAELLRKGVDKVSLYERLINRQSEDAMRLNSFALLERMEVFADRGAALIRLTRDELNRFRYAKGDTEGLVNKPLAIPGVVYSAFMREEEDYIKVSMRSTGDFPVNVICKEHFGGGGHINAAGGEFYGTLDEACDLFRSLLDQNKTKYIDKNETEQN